MFVPTSTAPRKGVRERRGRRRDNAPQLLPACPTCGGDLFPDTADPLAPLEWLCAGCIAFAPARDVTPDPSRDVSDLPGPLQLGRRSLQHVFRILRDLGTAWPADVVEEWARRIDPFPSRITVHHALATLRDAGFVTHSPAGWTAGGPRCRKEASRG